MKKAVLIIALAIVAIALMGCPTVNVPFAVGDARITKTGQASGKLVFGIFGNVQTGIADAAKAGGITKVATVDVQTNLFLGGLVVTLTTTVTGE